MTTEAEQGAAGAAGAAALAAATGAQPNQGGAAPPASGAQATANPAAPTQPQNFHELLPAELRTDPAFKDFKTVEAMARSYKHAMRFTGNQDPNRMVLWPTDGDDKAMGEIYKRMGRPDTADGYKLENVKVPEGLPWDADFQKTMVGVFHEAGLNEKQVEKVLTKYIEMEQGIFAKAGESQKKAATDSEAALRKEWGLKFDENFALAEKVLETHASDTLVEKVKGWGLHNDADFVRFLAKAGQGMSEADLRFTGGNSMSGALTPDQAKAEIAAKKADPVFFKQWTNRDDPGHDHAVKVMNDLYKAALPEPVKK